MNIYTILGAALVNPSIRRLLFRNPADAARALGLILTKIEVEALERLVKRGDGKLEEHFATVQRGICPKPPCPYMLATEDDDADADSSTSAAD